MGHGPLDVGLQNTILAVLGYSKIAMLLNEDQNLSDELIGRLEDMDLGDLKSKPLNGTYSILIELEGLRKSLVRIELVDPRNEDAKDAPHVLKPYSTIAHIQTSDERIIEISIVPKLQIMQDNEVWGMKEKIIELCASLEKEGYAFWDLKASNIGIVRRGKETHLIVVDRNAVTKLEKLDNPLRPDDAETFRDEYLLNLGEMGIKPEDLKRKTDLDPLDTQLWVFKTQQPNTAFDIKSRLPTRC